MERLPFIIISRNVHLRFLSWAIYVKYCEQCTDIVNSKKKASVKYVAGRK